MPTVLRVGGLRIAVYPNDHPPAHVHVIGSGWVVVINLTEPDGPETIGCDEREARRVPRLIAPHQKALMDAWRGFHG